MTRSMAPTHGPSYYLKKGLGLEKDTLVNKTPYFKSLSMQTNFVMTGVPLLQRKRGGRYDCKEAACPLSQRFHLACNIIASCYFSKLFTIVFKKRLEKLCAEHNIISDARFGFWKRAVDC